MRDHLLWFIAGGFTGLALARWLARLWWRLFWVAATALFATGAFLLLTPDPMHPQLFQSALRAAQAATRVLVAGAEGWK